MPDRRFKQTLFERAPDRNQIEKTAALFPDVDVETIERVGRAMDPDPNWKHGQWILKQMKLSSRKGIASQGFAWSPMIRALRQHQGSNYHEHIKAQIEKFELWKKAQQIRGDEGNLDRYTYRDMHRKLRSLPPDAFVSKREKKRKRANPLEMEGSELVAQSPMFRIYHATEPTPLAMHSANTGWCTSVLGGNLQSQYLKKGGTYVVYSAEPRDNNVPSEHMPGWSVVLQFTPDLNDVEQPNEDAPSDDAGGGETVDRTDSWWKRNDPKTELRDMIINIAGDDARDYFDLPIEGYKHLYPRIEQVLNTRNEAFFTDWIGERRQFDSRNNVVRYMISKEKEGVREPYLWVGNKWFATNWDASPQIAIATIIANRKSLRELGRGTDWFYSTPLSDIDLIDLERTPDDIFEQYIRTHRGRPFKEGALNALLDGPRGNVVNDVSTLEELAQPFNFIVDGNGNRPDMRPHLVRFIEWLYYKPQRIERNATTSMDDHRWFLYAPSHFGYDFRTFNTEYVEYSDKNIEELLAVDPNGEWTKQLDQNKRAYGVDLEKAPYAVIAAYVDTIRLGDDPQTFSDFYEMRKEEDEAYQKQRAKKKPPAEAVVADRRFQLTERAASQQQMQATARQLEVPAMFLQHIVSMIDPADNDSHGEWIVKQIRAEHIQLPDGPPTDFAEGQRWGTYFAEISELIEQFELARRNKAIRGAEADLNQYDTVDDLRVMVEGLPEGALRQVSKRAVHKGKADPMKMRGNKLVAETPNWKIFHATDRDTMKMHSVGTGLCTRIRASRHFQIAQNKGGMYVVYHNQPLAHSYPSAHLPNWHRVLVFTEHFDDVSNMDNQPIDRFSDGFAPGNIEIDEGWFERNDPDGELRELIKGLDLWGANEYFGQEAPRESVTEMASGRELTQLAKWLNTEMDTGDATMFLREYLEEIEASQELRDEADSDPWDFLERYPDVNKAFAEWLPERFESVASIGMVSDLPAWHFFTDATVVRNDIVVRRTGFTDPEMALEGWDRWEALAYTGYYQGYPGEKRVPEGWCFGYEYPSRDAASNKYGNNAVVVRTSYVRAYHYGDNEYQAIFPCKSAKVLGMLLGDGSYWYDVYPPKADEPIVNAHFDEAVGALLHYEEKRRRPRKQPVESTDRRFRMSVLEGRAVCAWCGKDLGERPDVEGITHGFCKPCAKKMIDNWEFDERTREWIPPRQERPTAEAVDRRFSVTEAKRKKIDRRFRLTEGDGYRFTIHRNQGEGGEDPTRALAAKGFRRAKPVGKRVGQCIYAHRQYEDQVVPEDVLAKARELLQGEYADHDYNAIKFDRKSNAVTFQQSPDFDTADEPTVGRSVKVSPDGKLTATEMKTDPQIWHHKWMWVDDDYDGFDVEASKRRSLQWLPHVKKGESSRIGTKSYWNQLKPRWRKIGESVDRDSEAEQMLDRYNAEPTNIWMYTDMPVKDRVAWAYLAADRFMGVEGEDLVERFVETLRLVVEDPDSFWQQVSEKDPDRAQYLDGLEWNIETVSLEDVGVYPRFSGFSDEVCAGSVVDTAVAIQDSGELPEKAAKLRDMSEVWQTVMKFLPPVLIPGQLLRGGKPGYAVLDWTCDDGNHRLVSAAMGGAIDAVCFVGREPITVESVVESTFREDPSFQNISRLLDDNAKYALSLIARGAEHYEVDDDREAYYNRLDRLVPAAVPQEEKEDAAYRALEELEAYGLITWGPTATNYASVFWTETGPQYAAFEEMIPGGLPEADAEVTVDRAINLFGLTRDPVESGWLLPDGRMLDFSGKREDPYSAGKRYMDHSEVGQLSGVRNLHDFADQTGAIRMSVQPHVASFQIHSRPTEQQRRIMMQLLKNTGYSGKIDVISNNRVVHYQEINNQVDARRILSKASMTFMESAVQLADRRFKPLGPIESVTEQDRSYFDVGHDEEDAQPWWIRRDSDDIKIGDKGSSHSDYNLNIRDLSAWGRISHDSRSISLVIHDAIDLSYVLRILKMDYPKYSIHKYGEYNLDIEEYFIGGSVTEAVRRSDVIGWMPPDGEWLPSEGVVYFMWSAYHVIFGRGNAVIERAELTPDEVSSTNATCRTGSGGSSWAQKSKVHDFFREHYTPETAGHVLDFGAGNPPTHGQALVDDGYTVDFHEHGDNVDPNVHNPEALNTQYDVVLVSKVINVQPNPEALDITLGQIRGSTKDDGVAIMNYPEPHKIMRGEKALTPVEVQEEIKKHFDTVEYLDGTSSNPIFVAMTTEVVRTPVAESVDRRFRVVEDRGEFVITAGPGISAEQVAAGKQALRQYVDQHHDRYADSIIPRFSFTLTKVDDSHRDTRYKFDLEARHRDREQPGRFRGTSYTYRPLKNAVPVTDIESDPNMAYRGMSFEEWQLSKKHGRIWSAGEHNLPGQEERTYFGLEFDTAAHYAAGFSPIAHIPTRDRPGVVVEVPREFLLTQQHDRQHIGDTEAAAEDPIPLSEVGRAWYIVPEMVSSGYLEVVQDKLSGKTREGSRSNPNVITVAVPVSTESVVEAAVPRFTHCRYGAEGGNDAVNVSYSDGSEFQYIVAPGVYDRIARWKNKHAIASRLKALAIETYEVMDSEYPELESVTEQVGSGEWWIDDMGIAEFADGDIGDVNHAMVALGSMVGLDVMDPHTNSPQDLIPMEPISPETAEWLEEREVDADVIKALRRGDDPREWAIEHMGWIRLAGHNAELWQLDNETLDRLRSGVWEAWTGGEDFDAEELETEIGIEEAKTRTLLEVPLRALMDERYDAESIRRLGLAGEPVQWPGQPTPAAEFMKAAWARKAAGERGIDEMYVREDKYTILELRQPIEQRGIWILPSGEVIKVPKGGHHPTAMSDWYRDQLPDEGKAAFDAAGELDIYEMIRDRGRRGEELTKWINAGLDGADFIYFVGWKSVEDTNATDYGIDNGWTRITSFRYPGWTAGAIMARDFPTEKVWSIAQSVWSAMDPAPKELGYEIGPPDNPTHDGHLSYDLMTTMTASQFRKKASTPIRIKVESTSGGDRKTDRRYVAKGA